MSSKFTTTVILDALYDLVFGIKEVGSNHILKDIMMKLIRNYGRV